MVVQVTVLASRPMRKEIWVVDAHNQSLHVFDAQTMPPKQLESIKLADEPGWITFSPDGKYAYPSTGQVIDVKTRKVLLQLTDETGTAVQSEKMHPEEVSHGKLKAVANQFGLGRKLLMGTEVESVHHTTYRLFPASGLRDASQRTAFSNTFSGSACL